MYLGIDVGTQSVKTLLYDPQERRIVDVRSSALQLISKRDGTREQLAQWWLDGLGDCLARISPALKSAVAAIGVSGQQHGFVALDAAGEVLAPVKLWCDTATVQECAELTALFGGVERCIAALGNPILPGYTASKIVWLKKHRPALYQKLATILLPHDYINFCLTGERVMEFGDASGTGLLDITTRAWHTPMLNAVDEQRDLSTALPELLHAGAQAGALRANVAQALGLPAGVPVATGGGDNMMAAIGTGNVSPGRLTVSLGTSGTLFACSDTPVVDPAGRVAAFCSSSDSWLPLVCTMNCTVSTQLTRRAFGVGIDALQRQVESVPPGANGVVTLPFFNGERTPDLPNGKGCVLGLDENNYTQANLLRSAMESAVYGLRAGLDALNGLGVTLDTVRLTGGGAGSAAWRQMVADIFNLPVTVQTDDEGAALGAALQAMWMHTGCDNDLQALVDSHLDTDPARGCVPHPETAQEYAAHYRQYTRHVDVVSALYV